MASSRGATLAALLVAIALAGGARAFAGHANSLRAHWPPTLDPPWAPSADAAPFVSLGYREALADLLWIRFRGYVGGDEDRAHSTRLLAEAIAALDPRFKPIYWAGGQAITAIGAGASEDDYLRAIALLERGAREFPDDYRIPLLAGQLYMKLKTDDPDKAARWAAEGARWLERAVHVPGAPADAATKAAFLRTRLGQRELAIQNLRELAVLTRDPQQRDRLVKKIAELAGEQSDEIDYEVHVANRRFQEAWDRDRPELPPSAYILIGPPLPTWFDPASLAVDRDLVGAEPPLEPLGPVPD